MTGKEFNLSEKAKELEKRIKRLEMLRPLVMTEKEREAREKLDIYNKFIDWKKEFIKRYKDYLKMYYPETCEDFISHINKLNQLSGNTLIDDKGGENKNGNRTRKTERRNRH